MWHCGEPAGLFGPDKPRGSLQQPQERPNEHSRSRRVPSSVRDALQECSPYNTAAKCRESVFSVTRIP
jgi:hypothetical protein